MANVKIKKILKPFTYKGEEYQPGDEASVSPQYAAQLQRLDYITLEKEANEQVQKILERNEKNAMKEGVTSEKNSKAGPGK